MNEYKIDYILKINKHVSEWKSLIIIAKDKEHAIKLFTEQKSNHKRIISYVYKLEDNNDKT